MEKILACFLINQKYAVFMFQETFYRKKLPLFKQICNGKYRVYRYKYMLYNISGAKDD